MAKQKIVIAALILTFIAFIVVMKIYLSDSSLNVLGNEGYFAYDKLLAGNSYDKSLWNYKLPDCSYAGYNLASCSAVQMWEGVSAKDGSIQIAPAASVKGIGVQQLQTKDLRLQNFKFGFSVVATRCGSNQYYHGGTSVYTNYGLIYSYPPGSGSLPSGSTYIELLWDDYALGHYQIKANGVVVQEGIVPDGQKIYFYIVPQDPWIDSCSATAIMVNPFIQPLFACDVQPTQAKVHVCFAGPQTVQVSDLKGFQSFCTSLPATFNNRSLITSSKQVYYSLAQNKQLQIYGNQTWEFQYIADSASVGFPTNQTGVVELCKQNFVVADLASIPEVPPTVLNQQVLWSSSGRYDGSMIGFKTKNVNLLSGTSKLFETEPLAINENLCPYKETWSVYPGISLNCVSLIGFGHKFFEGDSYAVNPYLTAKLVKIIGQYRLDDSEKIYRWSGLWQLDFAKNAVEVTQKSGINDFQITNHLGSSVTVSVVTTNSFSSIDQDIVGTQQIVLAAGQTLPLNVVTYPQYVGLTTLSLQPVIQTSAGSVSQQAFVTTYNGNQMTPTNTTAITADQTETTGFFEKIGNFFSSLWNSIKSFFST